VAESGRLLTCLTGKTVTRVRIPPLPHMQWRVFLAVFVVALLVQSFAWSKTILFDDQMWHAAVEETRTYFVVPLAKSDYAFTAYLYPAAPIITISALLNFKIATEWALRATLVLLISLGIALAALVSRSLRPQSLWWIGVSAVLIFSPSYYTASLALAVLLPYVVLIALGVLYVGEHRTTTSLRDLLLFGAVSGFALSLRFDMTATLLVITLPFLVYALREKILVWSAAALVSFFVFDPRLWLYPLQYFGALGARIHESYASAPFAPSSYVEILTYSPPFLLALSVIVISLFFKQPALPRTYSLWLIAVVFGMGGALLCSPSGFHPLWYFFPLFIIFEVIFPYLWLWTAEYAAAFSTLSKERFERIALGLYVALQLLSFVIVFA
jgi:hypothetical protein